MDVCTLNECNSETLSFLQEVRLAGTRHLPNCWDPQPKSPSWPSPSQTPCTSVVRSAFGDPIHSSACSLYSGGMPAYSLGHHLLPGLLSAFQTACCSEHCMPCALARALRPVQQVHSAFVAVAAVFTNTVLAVVVFNETFRATKFSIPLASAHTA